MITRNLFLIAFLFIGLPLLNAQIIIDERYDDWSNSELLYTDQLNDVASNRIDLHRLWVSNDADNLYIRFTIDNFKIDLQESNGITLYIDYDQNRSTGQDIFNIGADLVYSFGELSGLLTGSAGSDNIDQYDIRIIALPTVTATDFEIAIRRRNRANGVLVQPSDNISIVLKDGATGDQIPESNETLNYTLSSTTESYVGDYTMSRPSETDFRIMSLNALRDQITERDRGDNYERVIKAIAPDIIAFQEIYDSGASDISDLLNLWSPHPAGPWRGERISPDIILCSPYPIKETANVRGNGLFLMDFKGQDIFVINAHLFCCDNDLGRQEEVDDIMAFIRRAKQGQGVIPLEDDTPIIILGDMNFVGFDNQRTTLLTGDIDDENRFGNDFNPDWDGTDFEMADTYTTGSPFVYTWTGSQRFAPGRLDYIFYSDAVMSSLNSFALNTSTMSVVDRVSYDLNLSDSDQLSDHLAIVSDFDVFSLVDNEELKQENNLTVFPNPLNGEINITLPEVTIGKNILISISDLQGRLIFSKMIAIDQKQLQLDNLILVSGMYALSLSINENVVATERLIKQ